MPAHLREHPYLETEAPADAEDEQLDGVEPEDDYEDGDGDVPDADLEEDGPEAEGGRGEDDGCEASEVHP